MSVKKKLSIEQKIQNVILRERVRDVWVEQNRQRSVSVYLTHGCNKKTVVDTILSDLTMRWYRFLTGKECCSDQQYHHNAIVYNVCVYCVCVCVCFKKNTEYIYNIRH